MMLSFSCLLKGFPRLLPRTASSFSLEHSPWAYKRALASPGSVKTFPPLHNLLQPVLHFSACLHSRPFGKKLFILAVTTSFHWLHSGPLPGSHCSTETASVKVIRVLRVAEFCCPFSSYPGSYNHWTLLTRLFWKYIFFFFFWLPFSQSPFLTPPPLFNLYVLGCLGAKF